MSINLDNASQDHTAGPDTQVMTFSKPETCLSDRGLIFLPAQT
ncbi:hypothetical protein GLAD_02655 [Leclercia adecarboxylata ATCC 23216 = NBRC 102595]|nr:hypothetical protein GLAD_02655 [Leclercia adecarboxylata ATCC 23216 = NBRC 102595]